MNFPLIICGMHRSGTSLISAFAQRSGVHMGDELIGATPGNIRGHFEDREIVQFHSHLQAHAGYDPLRADEFARNFVARRSSRPAWGWKDPRTCEFLNFWHRHAPKATFLFMVRHPFEVADSLRRRDETVWHWSADTIRLTRWSEYTSQCLDFAQAHASQSIVAVLNHVLRAPEKFSETLGKRLDLSLSGDTLTAEFEPTMLAVDPSPFRVLAAPRVYLSSLRLYGRACRLSRQWSRVDGRMLTAKNAIKDIRTNVARVVKSVVG